MHGVMTNLVQKDKKSVFSSKQPKANLADIVLTGTTQLQINQIINEQENKHLLLKRGLYPKRKVLFYGAAGTGKTLGAEGVAHHLNKTLNSLNLEHLSATNPDDALNTIQIAFDIINQSNDVYLFDEFDAIAGNRHAQTGQTHDRRISNALLIAFENIKSNAILICATNFIATIDPAFRRRFDTICKFELPMLEERKVLLASVLAKYQMTASTDDIQSAAKATENLSHHEVEGVALAAIKTALLQDSTNVALISEIPSALERKNSFKKASDFE